MTPRRDYSRTVNSAQAEVLSKTWTDNFDSKTVTFSTDFAAPSTVDAIYRLRVFLRQHVLCLPSGHFRSASIVRKRLAVLTALLEPTVTYSLAAEARELKCTRAALSIIARQFERKFGLRAIRTNGDRSKLKKGRKSNGNTTATRASSAT